MKSSALATRSPASRSFRRRGGAALVAAYGGQVEEASGRRGAVAGFAQLQAQVMRGLACVVRSAVADEFRVAELLDGRNEMLDLPRFHRGGRPCRWADEKCERKNRQRGPHRFRTACSR